jgi:hypothetical protein
VSLDVEASLGKFILDDLGIDLDGNLSDHLLDRAGTNALARLGGDVLLERNSIEVRAGALYETRQLGDASQLFADPASRLTGISTEVAFTLPNGLLGFALADESGNLVEELPASTGGEDFPLRTVRSLMALHASGVPLVVDRVRDFVEANPLDFDAATLAAVQDIYPEAERLALIIEQDSALYQLALARLGLDPFAPEPVSASASRFAQDLDAAAVAGELVLSEATLLASFQPRLYASCMQQLIPCPPVVECTCAESPARNTLPWR